MLKAAAPPHSAEKQCIKCAEKFVWELGVMGDCVMKEFPNANCQTEYCLTSTNGGLGRFVIAQILPTFLNHILFVRYVLIYI